jgi:hypothetical protein
MDKITAGAGFDPTTIFVPPQADSRTLQWWGPDAFGPINVLSPTEARLHKPGFRFALLNFIRAHPQPNKAAGVVNAAYAAPLAD